jgi:soluble lytic murein transglycosylase
MRRALAFLLLTLIAMGGVGLYVVETEPDWYLRLRYPLQYEPILTAHADNYDLDPALLAAVIYSESKFDPTAVSTAGAIGLMQLLPDTAQGIADHTGGGNFTTADLYDPELNIRYGAYYLKRMQRKYSDHPQSLDLALAAYNAGQGNVDRPRCARADPVPRDARLPGARARRPAGLPAGLRTTLSPCSCNRARSTDCSCSRPRSWRARGVRVGCC